ncbi:MAG TPA: PLDc N-terminal domain-containing protein [Acidimicrobiia bacterium]|nr:PLDc N-terminal domain-containing protein [Acidimicrobiia bacterium]
MRQVHAVAGALVAWGTAAAVGFVLNRAVTDPDGALLGLDNHVWMTIAWWTVFAVLPLVAILDASVIPQEDWWAAHSTKVGWIGIVAFVPAIGPLLYFTVIRPRVAGRYAKDHPQASRRTP